MSFVLYNHVGSANHGCEALVRTLANLLGENNTILLSDSLDEEKKYGIDKKIKSLSSVSDKKSFLSFVCAYIKLKMTGNYFHMDALPYKEALKSLSSDDILVSIGGDIFCYDNYPKYILIHNEALKHVKKSILLGCSIEPDLLKDKILLKDLKSFDLITARESITYNALKKAGIDSVYFFPDSAFTLEKEETSLPAQFIVGNTVGLNISPLAIGKSNDSELILDNYRNVIKCILNDTDSSIALIPHVVWDGNDDREPLKKLYDEFAYTGRVCIIDDQNCMKLKYIISKCRFFIGARTHATIAAYSSCVPTLVVGYSVKAKGIAKDIFGTYDNYVLPVQSLKNPDDLTAAFKWLLKNENKICMHLAAFMPGYIKKAQSINETVYEKVK